MNKQLLNALLCGALVLSTGTFISCDDDNDELDSRVAVVEGAYGEIKTQLSQALMTGASIVKSEQDNEGNWTLTLSDGSKIVIKASTGGGGGGSSISVEAGSGFFKITVDGTTYTIPTGAAVNSLVFVPEFADGKVLLGNEGATVKLLATPALSADDMNKAQISVVDAVELQTRLATETIIVTGQSLDGDYIKLNLKGIDAQAGKSYAIAIKLDISGTSITSNYFTVEVAADFSFDAESLVTPTFGAAITDAVQNGDGSYTATLPDGNGSKPNFLSEFNFGDFVQIADVEGLTYVVAPANKQNENVQRHYEVLKNSLSKDGKWKIAGRPGTNCDAPVDGEGNKQGNDGLLIYLKANYQIKAKIYWKVIDPIAALDFTGGRTGNFEAEWGGREQYQESGKHDVDIQKILANWETEIPIIHGGKDNWFALWNDYSVQTADQDIIIFNDGGRLKVSDYGQKYCSLSRGVYWFYRGFAIYVPEALGTDGKYVADNGEEFSAGEGYGVDNWMGQYTDYINDPIGFYSAVAKWNFKMDEATGIITFPETYTGYGLRIAIDGGFEYDYGVKPIHGAGSDQCGMLFFNRRVAPTDATMPSKK